MIESGLILTALAALALYVVLAGIFKRRNVDGIAFAGLAALLCWTVFRTLAVHHAPFSGAYESMVFFAFLYGLKINMLSGFSGRIKAALLIPAGLLLAAALLLSAELKAPNPLVPALESFWIYIHVPGIFIGYVSLLSGFVLALLGRFGNKNTDELLDREMKLALFFITFGIITGGFWAQLSWGSFWNWDPKETSALVTWCFVCPARHYRKTAFRNTFIYLAFVSMLFTYFGVMFLLPGLHSYQ